MKEIPVYSILYRTLSGVHEYKTYIDLVVALKTLEKINSGEIDIISEVLSNMTSVMYDEYGNEIETDVEWKETYWYNSNKRIYHVFICIDKLVLENDKSIDSVKDLDKTIITDSICIDVGNISIYPIEQYCEHNDKRNKLSDHRILPF